MKKSNPLFCLCLLLFSYLSHAAPVTTWVIVEDERLPQEVQKDEFAVATTSFQDGYEHLYFGKITKSPGIGALLCQVKDRENLEQTKSVLPLMTLKINAEGLLKLMGKADFQGHDLEKNGSWLFENIDNFRALEYPELAQEADNYTVKFFQNEDRGIIGVEITLNGHSYHDGGQIFLKEFDKPEESSSSKNLYDAEARKNPSKVVDMSGTPFFYIGCGWVKKDGKTVPAKDVAGTKRQAEQQLGRAAGKLRSDGVLETTPFFAIDQKHYAAGDSPDHTDTGGGKNRVYARLSKNWKK